LDFEDIKRIKKLYKLKRFIPGFPDRNSVVYFDGYDYGHGYGHRKGRGNRWDHEIDDLILDYMLEADWKYLDYVYDQIWRDPHQYHRRQPNVKHTQSELAKVVRDHKGIGVSWDTIKGHLKILAEEPIIIEGRKMNVIRRLPKRGSNNEIYYSLSNVRRFGRRKPLVKA
jgi:hypothetical protein